MVSASDQRTIDTVLFDFGGVLADEGFRKGLEAIGKISGVPEESVIQKGHHLVIETGYVTGRTKEARWWDALRSEAGIRGTDEELRREILDRFTLRPWMLDHVKRLKDRGFTVGILSDQTNWLDELNVRFGFYGCFDFVFNSYHMGKSKIDPTHFDDVVKLLKREGQAVLFIDDNSDHVERAAARGWNAVLYKNQGDVLRELEAHLPGEDADRQPR